MDTTVSSSRTTAATHPARSFRGGMRTRIFVLVALGLVAASALAYWIYGRMTHVFVYDARIAADVVSVSSRVSGWVTELTVIEGDAIEAGHLLVRIDARDSRLRLAEIAARVAAMGAEEAQLAAQIDMTARLTRSRMEKQRAQLAAANATLAAQRSDLNLAQNEFRRATSLLERKVISRQKWENDRTRYQKALEESRRVEAQLAAARAALLEAEAARQEVRVLDKKLETLRHRRDQLTATHERQKLDLEDRDIRGAFAGVID
ncbi:MAG: HlyD family secretion protein, partial [Alphaproteobacteria bacterium]